MVAALDATLGPTRQLIEDMAAKLGTAVEVSDHLCGGAWDRFEAGDQTGYITAIAATCAALEYSCDVIVLAQASMAAAADLAEVSVPVLTSPALAVDAAIRAG